MSQDTPFSAEQLAEHAGYLRALARGLVRDRGVAEDLVQETLLRAVERPPRSGKALAGWLRTVIRNLAANRWREGVRRDRRERTVARPESLESTAQVVERHEVLDRVTAALRHLPEPYQETLHHRYFRDLTPTQIADRLDLPLATVKARLRRGLEKLRERLDQEHGGDRRAWALALIPLLDLPLPPPTATDAPTATTPAAAPIALGGLLMKKVMLTVTCLACLTLVVGVYAGWFDSEAPGVEEPPQATPVAAAEPEDAPAPVHRKPAVVPEPAAGVGRIRPHVPDGFAVQVIEPSGDPAGKGVRVWVYDAEEAADPVAVMHGALAAPHRLVPLMRRYGVQYETDAGGRVRVRRPVDSTVYMIAQAEGRIGSGSFFGSMNEPARLGLEPTGSFAVKVVDGAGRPVPEVQVQARFVGVWRGRPPLVALTGRLDGLARFPHLRLGRHAPFGQEAVEKVRLQVACPLTEPVAAEVALDALPASPLVLRLPATGALEVRLEEPDGTPAKGLAKVALVPAARLLGLKNLLPVVLGARTVRSGRVLFPHVTPGCAYVALAVRVEGASLFRLKLPMVSMGRGMGPAGEGERATVTVRMRPPLPHLTGRVVDPSGKPLVGRKLRWKLVPELKGDDHFKVDHAYRTVRTGEAGRFDLALPWALAKWKGRSLRLETWRVRRSGTPSPTGEVIMAGRAPLTTGAGNQDLGDITLRKDDGLLSGQVVDDLGRPLGGARIQLQLAEKRPKGRTFWVRKDAFSTQSDTAGRFTIRGELAPQPVKLMVSKPGHLDVPWVESTLGRDDVVLTLPRGARVAGSLLLPAGVTWFQVKVELRNETKAPPGPGSFRANRPATGAVGPKGQLVFGLVTPGPKTLTITLPGQERHPLIRIEGILAEAGKTVRDPRLQGIDLRDRIHPVKVDLVLPAGVERIPFDYAFGPDFTDKTYHRGGKPVLLARRQPVDILIMPRGYRAQLFRSVEGAIRLVPRPPLELRLALPPGYPDPGPDCRLKVSMDLVRTQAGAKVSPSIMINQDRKRITAYGTNRRASLNPRMAGTYRLTWVVVCKDRFLFLDGSRVLKTRRRVKVADSRDGQEVTLVPDLEEYTRALAYARACARVFAQLRKTIPKPTYDDLPLARKRIKEATKGLR